MRARFFLVPMLGSLCVGGGCTMNVGAPGSATSCPSPPPHAHYDAKWVPGHSICSSYSALSPPNADAGDGWSVPGMRGIDAGSSKSGDSSWGSGGCSSTRSSTSWEPPKCTRTEWIEGQTQCTLQCDADAIQCNGGCASLRDDADNCGACGRTCKQCFGGSCQPVTTMLVAPARIRFLATQGGAIYWSQANAIGRAPIDMLQRHTFLSYRAIAGGPVADEAAVYWTEIQNGALHVVSHIDGRPDAVLHARSAKPRDAIARLAVDDDNVYFTDENEPTQWNEASPEPITRSPYALFATSKLSGETRYVAPLTNASDVASGGGFVYFVEINSAFCHLRRVHPEDGGLDDFADICPKRLLAADADAVDYDDDVSVVRLGHRDASKLHIAGSGAFASDAQAFYTTRGFDILRTDRPSGPSVVLAGLQTATDLVVRGDSIYWANEQELRTTRTTIPKP